MQEQFIRIFPETSKGAFFSCTSVVIRCVNLEVQRCFSVPVALVEIMNMICRKVGIFETRFFCRFDTAIYPGRSGCEAILSLIRTELINFIRRLIVFGHSDVSLHF